MGFKLDHDLVLERREYITMKRGTHLFLLFLVVVAFTSAGSHAIVRLLKIRYTYGGLHHYGPTDQKTRTVLHGSSLSYSAVNWLQVAEQQGGAIDSWAVPGSSPSEWEINQRRFPNATRAFIVVSAYDLNEHILCDFRANMVPLTQALNDLWHSNSDWPLRRRVLDQYPMMLVRKPFPTVGRSDGVMTGVRDMARSAIKGKSTEHSSDAIRMVVAGPSDVQERISEWAPGHLERRLLAMRGASKAQQSFDGPKRQALNRLILQARSQGEVILVVVPVSRMYQEAFLDAKTTKEFELAITAMQQSDPKAQIIRLDQIESFHENALFSDLVHMNMFGQQVATTAFLNQLSSPKQ